MINNRPPEDEPEEEIKEEESMEKKSSKGDMVVNKICQQDKDIIVQWVDEGVIKRALVKPKDIKSEDGVLTVPESKLKKSYGENWSKFIKFTGTPEDFSNRLHQRGIWTIEDLIKAPTVCNQVLPAVFHFDIQTFLEKVKKEA